MAFFYPSLKWNRKYYNYDNYVVNGVLNIETFQPQGPFPPGPVKNERQAELMLNYSGPLAVPASSTDKDALCVCWSQSLLPGCISSLRWHRCGQAPAARFPITQPSHTHMYIVSPLNCHFSSQSSDLLSILKHHPFCYVSMGRLYTEETLLE